ncbi:hypothetical protein LRC39_21365 [Rhodopseudomonas sp. P1]|uniref:hypothetical protein n=1 Tax=Rhodopseudomonas sp. P1 TaxID=3434357 RepID=UPI0031FE1A7F
MTTPQLPNSESADFSESSSLDNGSEDAAAAGIQTGARGNTEFQTDSRAQIPPATQHSEAEVSRPETIASREREEIAKRIAAFRNLQISLKQEREDYYERTLARTRAALAPNAKQPR